METAKGPTQEAKGRWLRSILGDGDHSIVKKPPEQIAAIRDLVARTHEAWTIDKVCAAIKGAKKTDVEEVLESLEALGLRTGHTHHSTRRWKAASTRSHA